LTIRKSENIVWQLLIRIVKIWIIMIIIMIIIIIIIIIMIIIINNNIIIIMIIYIGRSYGTLRSK
jgi:hypothetical protein